MQKKNTKPLGRGGNESGEVSSSITNKFQQKTAEKNKRDQVVQGAKTAAKALVSVPAVSANRDNWKVGAGMREGVTAAKAAGNAAAATKNFTDQLMSKSYELKNKSGNQKGARAMNTKNSTPRG